MRHIKHNTIDVYISDNYDKFKMSKFNRDIVPNKMLEDSIVSKGLLNPIVVNNQMTILDGQHRFLICKEYSMPIEYIVLDSNEYMRDCNTTAIKWGTIDYLKNNSKYRKLYKLVANKEMSASTALAIADVTLPHIKKGLDVPSIQVINNRFKYIKEISAITGITAMTNLSKEVVRHSKTLPIETFPSIVTKRMKFRYSRASSNPEVRDALSEMLTIE